MKVVGRSIPSGGRGGLNLYSPRGARTGAAQIFHTARLILGDTWLRAARSRKRQYCGSSAARIGRRGTAIQKRRASKRRVLRRLSDH